MNDEGIRPVDVAIAVGEPLGSNVVDGEAELDPVLVPGIEPTVVWAVRNDRGPHPMQVYVGRWPDRSVRVLSADQDAWAELTRAVGVHLADPAQARGYVESFLEVTRASTVIVRPIETLDDLPWRPGSDAEEEARSALMAAAPKVAPVTEATPTGFHVELTLVVDQQVQRNMFDVTPAGEISSSYRVLAKDLPLPIAL
jgi:hypothetical protein